MNTTSTLYNHIAKILADNTLDWGGDQLRLALLSSAYTPSAEHTVWADVSAHEISGTGYTSGGFALSNQTVSRSTGTTKCNADDYSISGVVGSARYGVVYADVTRNGLVKPLVTLILFDSTPADVAFDGNTFPVFWNSDGIVKLVVG
jgi:hypothetical protein